jgi:hypothetical protein
MIHHRKLMIFIIVDNESHTNLLENETVMLNHFSKKEQLFISRQQLQMKIYSFA